MDYKTDLIIDEARRIMLEKPHLKYYEAIGQAKELFKKVHQGGNPSGPKKNTSK